MIIIKSGDLLVHMGFLKAIEGKTLKTCLEIFLLYHLSLGVLLVILMTFSPR